MQKYTLENIVEKYNNKEQLDFLFFWGHTRKSETHADKSCFSQWYIQSFIVDDVEYSCCEQYMMCQKAKLFNDMDAVDKILRSDSPKSMKSLGRKVKNFDNKVWEDNKFDIALTANINKFKQNKELLSYMISTGDSIIVEASPYDKIWGIGMSANNNVVSDPNNWKGSNLLGFALMQVRDTFR